MRESLYYALTPFHARAPSRLGRKGLGAQRVRYWASSTDQKGKSKGQADAAALSLFDKPPIPPQRTRMVRVALRRVLSP